MVTSIDCFTDFYPRELKERNDEIEQSRAYLHEAYPRIPKDG